MVAFSESFGQSGPGERRQQLTVMFCDLVGSTRLSQRLDPEELRDLKRSFIKACIGPVERYDGHLAQVWGDGLLIYFGWPSAHEDDAERCVRSALKIVDAVTRERDIEPLAVRIGVATGPVVVGGGRSGSEAGLAVGEAPNLAQRLQTLAKANEILIAHATRTLLGDAFELTDLGSLVVKDFQAARAWRVEAERQAAGRFDAAHAGSPLSAFVGRADEVELLMRAWESARAGDGRAVLIGGEAGIGKSRLTEVLRERIADEPHTTLRYQCSRFHQDVALHPIIAQIEFAAGFARNDTPDQKLAKLQAILVGSATQRHECAYLFAALLSLPTERLAPPELSAQQQRENAGRVAGPARSTVPDPAALDGHRRCALDRPHEPGARGRSGDAAAGVARHAGCHLSPAAAARIRTALAAIGMCIHPDLDRTGCRAG